MRRAEWIVSDMPPGTLPPPPLPGLVPSISGIEVVKPSIPHCKLLETERKKTYKESFYAVLFPSIEHKEGGFKGKNR